MSDYLVVLLVILVISVPAIADDTNPLSPVVDYQTRITAERWNAMLQEQQYLRDKIATLEMQILQIKSMLVNNQHSISEIPCGGAK